MDLHAIDMQADNYLASGLAPSRVWALLCNIFENVHSNVIAERVAAAMLDR
jgi:hypothetical protein